MKLEHIAIWTDDIEGMKEFYEKYFHVTSSNLYQNKKLGSVPIF